MILSFFIAQVSDTNPTEMKKADFKKKLQFWFPELQGKTFIQGCNHHRHWEGCAFPQDIQSNGWYLERWLIIDLILKDFVIFIISPVANSKLTKNEKAKFKTKLQVWFPDPQSKNFRQCRNHNYFSLNLKYVDRSATCYIFLFQEYPTPNQLKKKRLTSRRRSSRPGFLSYKVRTLSKRLEQP